MSIAPSLLKKIFSILVITIFSISLLFIGLTNLQPKSVLAYGINIQTACSNAAENELYYNTGLSNNYYLAQNKLNYCDSAAFRCLFSNCSDGFNADETINKTCNFTISQGFTNCGSNTVLYPTYSSNYPYNSNCQYNYNNCYNNCVNCFEQAISQLQNGVNSYNLGNAAVNQDLLNNITNSGRLDIPTSITSYVNGNAAYTEVKNYNGTVLSLASFSINEQGDTTTNNSNSSSIVPNCYRNINLYICDSFSTFQLGNQFGSYGSLSIPFRSTFTITPTQNKSSYYNVGYNQPIVVDYYYDYDCNYNLFGCGY